MSDCPAFNKPVKPLPKGIIDELTVGNLQFRANEKQEVFFRVVGSGNKWEKLPEISQKVLAQFFDRYSRVD